MTKKNALCQPLELAAASHEIGQEAQDIDIASFVFNMGG